LIGLAKLLDQVDDKIFERALEAVLPWSAGREEMRRTGIVSFDGLWFSREISCAFIRACARP